MAKTKEKPLEDAGILEEQGDPLESLFAELGGDDSAKVNIYRVNADYHGKQEYVAACAPDAFSLDWLRDTYGPGQYRVHVRDAAGLRANKSITIAAPKPALPGVPIAAPESRGGNDVKELFGAFAAMMGEGFAKLGELIVKTSQANAAPPVDPRQSMRETFEMLATVKTLFQDPTPKRDPLELIMKGVEFARTIEPRENGEATGIDLLRDLAKEFLPPIAALTVANAQRKAAAVPPAPVSPSLPSPESESQMMQFFIRRKLLQICALADQSANPAEVAEKVVDEVPLNVLDELLGAETWFDTLKAICPDVAATPTRVSWFAMLRAEVEKTLTPEGELDTPSGDELSPDQPANR